MSKAKVSPKELEWWSFLVGKISEDDLSEENKSRLAKKRKEDSSRVVRDIEMTGSLFFDSDIELIGLVEAAEEFPIAQSTMSQAAREGRLKAKKYGNSWLTTRQDIEEAIKNGGLNPRN